MSWPVRKICCSRTPTKLRTWNSIRKKARRL